MLFAVKNAKGDWCVSIGRQLSDREVRSISWPNLTTRKILRLWVNKEKDYRLLENSYKFKKKKNIQIPARTDPGSLMNKTESLIST